MPGLPTVGGDDGLWGTKLNEFLGVEHNADGTHPSEVISGGVVLAWYRYADDTVPAAINAGAWTKIPLDYEEINTGIASVVGGSIILGAGTYECFGSVNITSGGWGFSRVLDTTHTVAVATGAYIACHAALSNYSVICGRFTLSEQSTLDLQVYLTGGSGTKFPAKTSLPGMSYAKVSYLYIRKVG